MFVVEERQNSGNGGKGVPTFEWCPAVIGGVDETTGLYLLDMQDLETRQVSGPGKVSPKKGALPHSIRRRFRVGDQVCLVPTRADKERAATGDVAFDSFFTPWHVQHVDLSRGKIGYTINSSSALSSSSAKTTRENVLPSHVSRIRPLQAADAQLFWTGTAADGAAFVDSGGGPSWALGAENVGDSFPEPVLSAVPGSIARGLRDIFDVVRG